jgi:predicted Zn-dependent protease
MPRVNAFVLPTKEIFVYSGLIDLLEKEEPLIAAVIAHEISAYVSTVYYRQLTRSSPSPRYGAA